RGELIIFDGGEIPCAAQTRPALVDDAVDGLEACRLVLAHERDERQFGIAGRMVARHFEGCCIHIRESVGRSWWSSPYLRCISHTSYSDALVSRIAWCECSAVGTALRAEVVHDGLRRGKPCVVSWHACARQAS